MTQKVAKTGIAHDGLRSGAFKWNWIRVCILHSNVRAVKIQSVADSPTLRLVLSKTLSERTYERYTSPHDFCRKRD